MNPPLPMIVSAMNAAISPLVSVWISSSMSSAHSSPQACGPWRSRTGTGSSTGRGRGGCPATIGGSFFHPYWPHAVSVCALRPL